MSLPDFRPPILRAPSVAEAYDLDAPGAFVRLTPERFMAMTRWAEVAGADARSVATARDKIRRLQAGRVARQAAFAGSDRAVDLGIGGHQLRFDLDPRVSNQFFGRVLKRDAAGRFLEHEPAVVRALGTRLGPGDLLVDIGAHVGYFSCFAAARGASVIAVEMQATLCDAIRRNAALNGLWQVHTICAALGREPAMAQLIRLNPAPGMQVQSEKARAGWVPVSSRNHDLVPILTVDQMLSMPPTADIGRTIVKVDVEGAEGLVLSGARRAIVDRSATFIVEIHLRLLETFSTSVGDLLGSFPAEDWRCVVLEDAVDRETDLTALIGDLESGRVGDRDGNVTVLLEPR